MSLLPERLRLDAFFRASSPPPSPLLLRARGFDTLFFRLALRLLFSRNLDRLFFLRLGLRLFSWDLDRLFFRLGLRLFFSRDLDRLLFRLGLRLFSRGLDWLFFRLRLRLLRLRLLFRRERLRLLLLALEPPPSSTSVLGAGCCGTAFASSDLSSSNRTASNVGANAGPLSSAIDKCVGGASAPGASLSNCWPVAGTVSTLSSVAFCRGFGSPRRGVSDDPLDGAVKCCVSGGSGGCDEPVFSCAVAEPNGASTNRMGAEAIAALEKAVVTTSTCAVRSPLKTGTGVSGGGAGRMDDANALLLQVSL